MKNRPASQLFEKHLQNSLGTVLSESSLTWNRILSLGLIQFRPQLNSQSILWIYIFIVITTKTYKNNCRSHEIRVSQQALSLNRNDGKGGNSISFLFAHYVKFLSYHFITNFLLLCI